MTEKYSKIKNKILEYATQDTEIHAIIAIGSSTRTTIKADEYSDLDLIIVTTNAEKCFTNEYANLFGNVSISFLEPTLGGGMERRVIYDSDKDVDMIILTPQQFEASIRDGQAAIVMNRGYTILYDSQGYLDLLTQYVTPSITSPDMCKEEFVNMVNDFYFHNIWAYKKILRGELWSAKMCIDTYLKNYLLKMIELYCHKINGVDVWHDGRFLDRWADPFILEELKSCFARYEKEDMKKALVHTHKLFSKITRAVADKLHYDYPEKAEKCAQAYLTDCSNRH